MTSTFTNYLFLIISIAVFFLLIRIIFKTCLKNQKSKNILFPIMTIAIIALSWILNLGWIRLIFAIPILIHLLIFLISICHSFKSTVKNRKALTLVILNITTFYLGYILLPDGGDLKGSERMLFGLINNEKVISPFWGISIMLILINWGLLIHQYITQKCQ